MLCAILAWPVVEAQMLDLPAPSTPSLATVQELLRKGDAWEAVRVLRRDPSPGAESKLWLGLAYYFSGQYKLFANAMSEAAAGLPTNPFPAYALGRYHLDIRQRAGDARKAFEETLQRSPSYAPALYHLGWCYELDQNLDKALELYRQADGYWLAHAGIARISLARDQLEQARRQVRSAAELKPDAAMVRLLYGRILERAGELRPALEQYEQASALDPTDAGSLYQAMRCAGKLQDKARASALLKRYRQVVATYGPGN